MRYVSGSGVQTSDLANSNDRETERSDRAVLSITPVSALAKCEICTPAPSSTTLKVTESVDQNILHCVTLLSCEVNEGRRIGVGRSNFKFGGRAVWPIEKPKDAKFEV
jgi:hypothetical protein